MRHTEWETVWTFETKRFQVVFDVAPDDDLDLSWDDDGSTRAGLESGEYTAFMARVQVLLDGEVVGQDNLGECIYESVQQFYTSHRDPDPMNRNCTIMRQAKGGSPDVRISICHYFPDMVSEAVSAARKRICEAPRLRCA